MLSWSNIISWLGIFLTIYLSAKSISYAFHSKYKRETREKQFYKVYLPIFIIIEPFIYKKITFENRKEYESMLERTLDIAKKNYELIDPQDFFFNEVLVNDFKREEFDLENFRKNYLIFCKGIDGGYEKLKRFLFLPKRNLYYRLNKKQFETKNKAILAIFKIASPQIVLLLITAILSVMLLNYLR